MILRLVLQSDIGGSKYHLDFNLYDTPIVTKVVEMLDKVKADRHSSVEYRIDQSFKQSKTSSLDYTKELNEIIDSVNAIGDIVIPDSDIIDLEIATHLQPDKLNHLHLIFQQYTEEFGAGGETQELLERVNVLVHMLETVPTEMDRVLMIVKQEYYRPKTVEDLDLTLTADDYESKLPWGMWGYLELDYNTVGKDLAACFVTSDVALATQHPEELSQQTTYSPAFAIYFDLGPEHKITEESDYLKMEEYYAWCNQHNVPLPFTEPEYKVGRVRLGEVCEDFTMEEIHKLVIDYPNIVELQTLNDK